MGKQKDRSASRKKQVYLGSAFKKRCSPKIRKWISEAAGHIASSQEAKRDEHWFSTLSLQRR